MNAETTLTAKDVLQILSDRAQWCRENGESDMRNILNTTGCIASMMKGGKTRAEILAEFAYSEDQDEDE